MLKDLLYLPIREPMKRVDALLKERLLGESQESILAVNRYVLGRQGKRIRPALLLFSFLASQTVDSQNDAAMEKATYIAAALELIHMASLVHDDLIDHAELRHDQPTVHKKFGDEVGIAMGVYFYARSLELIADAGNTDVLREIGQMVTALCQGEITQVVNRDVPDLSLDHYLTILREKTGVLFACACKSGGILAGADLETQQTLYTFGEQLGVVFQIADDYMDIMGDDETLGKAAGQDFELGEVTLPLLLLLDETTDESERKRLVSLMADKSLDSLKALRMAIKASNAPKQCKALGEATLAETRLQLDKLPDSPYKKSLKQLIDFVETRTLKSI